MTSRPAFRRKLAILGATCAALFAFGGLAAASASASQPEMLTGTGGNWAGITIDELGAANGGILETLAGEVVECNGTNIEKGEFTSPTRSKATLRNTGCSAQGGLATCTTPNEPNGNIVTELNGELVYTGEAKNIAAVRFWPRAGKGEVATTFDCDAGFFGGTFVTVQGTGLICSIEPTNTLTDEFTLGCDLAAQGVNEFTSYWDPSDCGSELPDVLESEGVGRGLGPSWPMEQSGLEANDPSGEQEIETSKEVEIKASSCV